MIKRLPRVTTHSPALFPEKTSLPVSCDLFCQGRFVLECSCGGLGKYKEQLPFRAVLVFVLLCTTPGTSGFFFKDHMFPSILQIKFTGFQKWARFCSLSLIFEAAVMYQMVISVFGGTLKSRNSFG